MNGIARRIVRLYPRAWRERYEEEFVALLEERPASLFDLQDIALGALDAWLRPQVASERRVMIGRMCNSVLLVLWAWVGAGFVGMAVGGVRLTQNFIARKAADLALMRAVEARLPSGARLLTFNLTLTFQHYGTVETVELFGLEPDALPTLLSDGRPTYLLLDVRNVETQWRGLPLEASYHRLRDGRGLTVLGEFDSYTLFRVGAP